ncbi:M23 family metallopeptidase [Halieaceae bacterium IMCC14734]|uniref:M23 family metallopeptidase n=1 Tax=Candidatus Litorirhabdus singularis TaxID=2518993 RepID=A0ABT3THN4_9GAMM|nr:M23 family metallopeptidase [Candidatus Litorirhabdus singularis]MCX2980897.1 M23 family metallopeptidase [Candidatus Litorirhabdus singularis]
MPQTRTPYKSSKRAPCTLTVLILLGLFSHSAFASACVELSGEPRQGALLWGKVASGSEVRLDDQLLQVGAGGEVVFGFGRDQAATAELVVSGPAACQQTLQVAAREYNIQRVEGVPQRTVTPDPEHLERIRREGQLVRDARSKSHAGTDFMAGFQWPVQGPISGVYGSQRVYNGTPGRPHYGVDVAVPKGTPVSVPAAGIVVLAEPDLFYSGGTLIIDHGSQVTSTFLHMSKVLARVGQSVEPGDIVGEVGATGRATGPHLDWRMNWRGRRVDPQLLVPPMP